MGRDNEFRTYRRPEGAVVSKSVQDAMGFANSGANLRKHNFKFGFDAPSAINVETATAAERTLYEQTKIQQQDNSQWLIQQKMKNRQSNIQWGLKSKAATSNDRYANSDLKHSESMNRTFSNLKKAT